MENAANGTMRGSNRRIGIGRSYQKVVDEKIGTSTTLDKFWGGNNVKKFKFQEDRMAGHKLRSGRFWRHDADVLGLEHVFPEL